MELLIHKDILVLTTAQVQISVETLILTFSLPKNDAVLVVVELTHHLNLLLMENGIILMVQLVIGLLHQVSKVVNGSMMTTLIVDNGASIWVQLTQALGRIVTIQKVGIGSRPQKIQQQYTLPLIQLAYSMLLMNPLDSGLPMPKALMVVYGSRLTVLRMEAGYMKMAQIL
jgi:hypothetical protein